jgi:hypothetical protein
VLGDGPGHSPGARWTVPHWHDTLGE